MAEALAGRVVTVTAVGSPGDDLYTAPTNSATRVRVKVFMVNVGSSLRTVQIVHTKGAGHPNGAGTVEVVDGYAMPIEGIPVQVLDTVLYGHGATPDKLSAYISGGSVQAIVQAVEFT